MIWCEVLLAVIAPAIAGGIIYAGRKHLERASGWIATAAMCMSALWILRLSGPVVDMYNSGGNPITIEYSWVARSNIRFGFLIDTLNLPIGLIVIAVTALSCFYSVRYMENEQDQRGYFGSLLLVLTGMIGVLFSIDLVQFYLFWELMLIPSYLLIARQGASKRRLVVAFKYFIFTHIGALLLLLGIVTMFSYTGTFNLAELPQKAQLIPPDASSVIFMLLLLGFLVKMAAFPLHTWL
ncbi:MAG: proton-conducting transporter membrane subunit, partial [Candidatus Bathyarchaeota archaeon]|nr:proton-conducting transporter membrane subunit [Candidatus Bathyarchaeota archaeon]